MPSLPPRYELVRLIKQAMRERAPLMHEQLAHSGELEKVLNERADQALASYQQGLSSMMEAMGVTHQEMVSAAMQARNEAARQAVEQAVEFDDLDLTIKTDFDLYEIEGRVVVEGYEARRGMWAAVWRDGEWHAASGLVCKEGRSLSAVMFLQEFPDADLAAARAFARAVPDEAFRDFRN